MHINVTGLIRASPSKMRCWTSLRGIRVVNSICGGLGQLHVTNDGDDHVESASDFIKSARGRSSSTPPRELDTYLETTRVTMESRRTAFAVTHGMDHFVVAQCDPIYFDGVIKK